MSSGVLVLLAICVIVAGVGGVNLVLLKYQADRVDFAKEEAEARILKAGTDAATEGMRFRQLIDRYALREALRQQNSTLASRGQGSVEVVRVPNTSLSGAAVARNP